MASPKPTTWEQRFVSVIKLFCQDRTPPDELVKGWVSNTNDDLQNWVGKNLNRKVEWAQCIEILDAASNLADTPEDGGSHLG